MSIHMLYCIDNQIADNTDFIELIRLKYPSVTIMEIDCIGSCALCDRSPYVVLNNRRLTARKIEELIPIVEEKIQELLK